MLFVNGEPLGSIRDGGYYQAQCLEIYFNDGVTLLPLRERQMILEAALVMKKLLMRQCYNLNRVKETPKACWTYASDRFRKRKKYCEFHWTIRNINSLIFFQTSKKRYTSRGDHILQMMRSCEVDFMTIYDY